MFYVKYPEEMEILKMLETFENNGRFRIFWKISNNNSKSRRQIMTARGVYLFKGINEACVSNMLSGHLGMLNFGICMLYSCTQS